MKETVKSILGNNRGITVIKKNRLFKDLGNRDCYFHMGNSEFIFSSEIKLSETPVQAVGNWSEALSYIYFISCTKFKSKVMINDLDFLDDIFSKYILLLSSTKSLTEELVDCTIMLPDVTGYIFIANDEFTFVSWNLIVSFFINEDKIELSMSKRVLSLTNHTVKNLLILIIRACGRLMPKHKLYQMINKSSNSETWINLKVLCVGNDNLEMRGAYKQPIKGVLVSGETLSCTIMQKNDNLAKLIMSKKSSLRPFSGNGIMTNIYVGKDLNSRMTKMYVPIIPERYAFISKTVSKSFIDLPINGVRGSEELMYWMNRHLIEINGDSVNIHCANLIQMALLDFSPQTFIYSHDEFNPKDLDENVNRVILKLGECQVELLEKLKWKLLDQNEKQDLEYKIENLNLAIKYNKSIKLLSMISPNLYKNYGEDDPIKRSALMLTLIQKSGGDEEKLLRNIRLGIIRNPR